MKTITIFLRSVIQEEESHLAMFDSNGNGAVDTLKTDVSPGDVVIWKSDCYSGIRSITRIYPQESKGGEIFQSDPKKRFLCKGYKLHIPKDVKSNTEEKYLIEYIPCNSEKPVIIDPFLRVPPPPRK
jgi:hypothetical protein